LTPLPTQEAGGHRIFPGAAPAEFRWIGSGETSVSPIFLHSHSFTDSQPHTADKFRRPGFLQIIDLPSHAFNMIVGRNSQLMASFKTAPSEYLTTIGGRHSRAKPVHAKPLVDSWLISPLWHESFSFLIV
jgi:hypothetical protein